MTTRRSLVFALCLAAATAAGAQEFTAADSVSAADAPAMPIELRVGRVAYHGDSIPHVIFPTFYKHAPLEFKNEREAQRYNRLVANVKKLLPLARLAKMTVIETYEYLETLPDEQSRREHLQRVEQGLKRQYAPVLRKLSRSQGRLLLKLIDRECGQTGYRIAQAFIGTFKANMYQTLAYCFGNSLSRRYDPEGDDRFTERVVRMVESGQL